MLGPVYDRLSQDKYYWEPDRSICIYVYQEISQQSKHILIEKHKNCQNFNLSWNVILLLSLVIFTICTCLYIIICVIMYNITRVF